MPQIMPAGRPAVLALLAAVATVTLAGCDLAEGILKLGFWSGVILVVLVLVVIWLAARALRGRGPRP